MTISDSLKKINSFSFDQNNINSNYKINNGFNNNLVGSTLSKDTIANLFRARCFGVSPGCGH